MPWPGPQPRLIFLLLILAVVGPPGLSAEGSVGCLFSQRICQDDEWCHDDLAFGQCLPVNGYYDEDDNIFRYSLLQEELHDLSKELRRLFALGYRWGHAYTQCRLQGMLYSLKEGIDFDLDSCIQYSDNDLEGALRALEGQEDLDPQEVAIIKYTPSLDDPHADFADEVYYPPMDSVKQQQQQDELRRKILGPGQAIDLVDMVDPILEYQVTKRQWTPIMRRSVTPFFDGRYGIPKYRRSKNDLKDSVDFLNEYENEFPDVRSSNLVYGEVITDFEKPSKKNLLVKGFSDKLFAPDGDNVDYENPVTLNEDLPESRIYFEDGNPPEPGEFGSGIRDEIFSERQLEFLNPKQDIFRELQQKHQQEDASFTRKFKQNRPLVYSEGGAEPEPLPPNIWDNFNLGFKRPERLDVKKPGPPFDPAITEPNKKGNELLPSMMKKEPRGANPNQNSLDARPFRDYEYVFVEFKNTLSNWQQGKDIIRNISNSLHIEPQDFTDSQIHPKSVSFKVLGNNNRGFNASQVAHHIADIKDILGEIINLEIVSVGVGNKVKMQTVIRKKINDDNQFIVVSLVCGILVASILATIVLIVVRRYMKSKEKLQGLARGDGELSKDYQDLCRARMAAKGSAVETVHDKGRVISLSRESENQSPSSRSSTSSWSEEPALHNMDISTGHMVLSYMEDHLKNKDRLDQEWVALCAYVAEPCETSIALKKENIPNNRYPEVVPYDHARVVLNELSNANGSNYINASSITDHDPRNPAYIATQGPLPHTAPDFWQLIWEQGAVVIVMLTRLTEGGTAMCHRYWPEEGSELYHIYEVHLVSEHIWCDDYLVRSFYLKNVKTGETRTVTQFHFLSWPEAGVPSSTKALLEFRRKVNKSYRGRSCPIVVHCSDGAGRTGTYCLIDMVLSRMAKGAKEIDIAATLEHLRDQRPRMVATKQQFEFVLTAVAEEVHAILKALPPPPPPQATIQDK